MYGVCVCVYMCVERQPSPLKKNEIGKKEALLNQQQRGLVFTTIPSMEAARRALSVSFFSMGIPTLFFFYYYYYYYSTSKR